MVLLPVLISLGFWQLDRAEQKRQLQAEFDHKQSLGPIPFSQLDRQQDLRYQPVRMRGKYINGKHLLLDNRIFLGVFGYEVVTPFRLADSQQIVLVNRGWLPADTSRRQLPTVTSPPGELEIAGDIHVPQGHMMKLADEQATGWPRVQQSIDIESLAGEFDLPVFPYSVRLHVSMPGVFERNWVVVNLQPERHTAYAVQWFAMSISLVAIALLANTNLWALMTGRGS